MTGIELGTESCVLVEVERGGLVPRLHAVHVVDPSEWPPRALARVRRRGGFSRHAAVVGWSADPAALVPLTKAGFLVEHVLTPEKALAMLAAERGATRGSSATAWLALSRSGAAMVILRGRDTLYSRRFAWQYRDVTRPKELLLQRYTLVAHLAPELQHGIAAVKARHGVGVESAVTCGGIPDLRTLTMALIEELDLEVDTLDSGEGIEASGSTAARALIDHAPALHLASTVTALPPPEAVKRHRWWPRSLPATPAAAQPGASEGAVPPVRRGGADLRP